GMGIRFLCPNGHKLNVKAQLAGQVGICPECQARVLIPSPAKGSGGAASESASSKPLAAPPAAELVPAPETLDQPATEDSPSSLGEVAEPTPQAQAVPVAKPVRPVAKAVSRPVDPPAPPPAEVWHLRTTAGEQLGPGDQQVFAGWAAEGKVTPDAYVWRAGWADWKLVSEVLSELPIRSPPEESPAAKSPQRESAASRYLHDRKRAAQRQKYMAVVLLGLVLVTAVTMVIVLRGTGGSTTPTDPEPAPRPPMAERPAEEPSEVEPPEAEMGDEAQDLFAPDKET
ncbi:MAG: DUF4339 domain-containing protein, partial [Planctomycetales bacterium]|nr:DUF4339 domain-containing protein [Planctomycetales bacterium]